MPRGQEIGKYREACDETHREDEAWDDHGGQELLRSDRLVSTRPGSLKIC